MTYYTILKWLCQHLFQLLSVVFLYQCNIANITDMQAIVKSLLEIRLAQQHYEGGAGPLEGGCKRYQRRDGEYTKKYTLGCIECIEYPSLWDAEGGLGVS